MKKIIICFASMVMAWIPAHTQDTITRPLDRWFYNCWVGDNYNLDTMYYTFTKSGYFPSEEDRAFGMTTEKPLTIYGIACGVGVKNPIPQFIPDENYEFVRLYLKQADTLQVIRQAKCHLRDPYYIFSLTPNNINRSWCDPEYKSCRVIESYFDTPVVVIDSFFVGKTSRIIDLFFENPCAPEYESIPPDTNYMWQAMATFYPNQPCAPQNNIRICSDPSYVRRVNWSNNEDYAIIFPILTPKPPQPEPGSGPVGTEKPDTQSGFVTLCPNPASKEVEVRSSYGMSCLEVYDAGGHKLAELQANGNSATIEVHGWPSGVYIVHVHTPLGKVAKKLHIK